MKNISSIFVVAVVSIAVGFCQPGSVDLNFDADGRVVIDMGATSEAATAVLYQPDGKIVAVGSGNFTNPSSAVARLNPDGSLDNTFGIGGRAYADFGSGITLMLWDAFLQPDGKIVQAGYSGTVDAEATLLRYNANGSIDNTFGINGIVTAGVLGIDIGLFAAALQADGKIVGTGIYTDGGTDAIAVIRFNSDGSIDNTFSYDGIAYVSIGVSGNMGNDLGLQSDGKILVCGTADLAPGEKYLIVTRFASNGVLDNTFGTNGTVALDFGQLTNIGKSIAVMNDDRIVVSGYADVGGVLKQVVARLLPDGTSDPSFGIAGLSFAGIGLSGSVNNNMTLQQDGKILLVATADNGTDADFGVLRFDAFGNLDPTFDGDGKVMTDFGSGNDQAVSITMQDDGLILVSGSADVGPEHDFALARYISGVNIGIGEVESYIGNTLIYPNPISTNNVVLEYTLTETQDITVDLYSLDGKFIAYLLQKETREPTQHKEEIQLPISLPNGVYLLRVQGRIGAVNVRMTINK